MKNYQSLEHFDPDKRYTGTQLNNFADELLREDARGEVCRECGNRGEETGLTAPIEQEAIDGSGHTLTIQWPIYACSQDHVWFAGEGAVRGIGGKDPILFEEHLQSRRRREILNVLGTPDPAIANGIYFRAHPEGRKINTEDARKNSGAGFFR